jgi:hypothetical protein
MIPPEIEDFSMTEKLEYPLKTPVKLASGSVLSTVSLDDIEIGKMIEIEESGATDSRQGMMVLAAMADLPLEDFMKIKRHDALAIKTLVDTTWGNEKKDGEDSPS